MLRVFLIKNTLLGKWYLKHKASLAFESRFHRKLNWKQPKDLNEKIQWLKFNSDITSWTELADKYIVREYVKKLGLENILVKLYGVWEDADKINFEELPDTFVLKTNNSSGTYILVRDKKNLDIEKTKKQLNQWIKDSKRIISLEIHYFKIKPLIIAEEYISSDKQDIKSNSLIDYKVWCFNGEPYSIWICYNRTPNHTYVGLYDINWKYHPEHSVFTDHYRKGEIVVPKPLVFDEMISACRELAKNHPQVRIDFYVVANKLYFGEMTFTSLGGSMNFYTQEYLLEMGEIVSLTNSLNRISKG